jgi:methyl-accepting chemotaxis protein
VASETRISERGLRLPIAFRIGGAIVLVTLLLAVFMVSYFPARQKSRSIDALETKAKVVAALTYYDIASALDFDDTLVVQEALKRMALDEDLEFVVVFDELGQRIAEYAGTSKERGAFDGWTAALEPKVLAAVQVFRRPQGVEVHHPISTPGGKGGTLVAAFGLERILEENRAAQSETIAWALLIVVIGVLVAYAVSRNISRRVRRVVATAERVARGELASAPIDDGARDEIGDITRSFNEMNRNLRRLSEQAARVAEGDLGATVDVEGELADAFNRMVRSQHELVRQIAGTARQLNRAAGEFVANASAQEHGATRQSDAVDQIQQTLNDLLASAREIGSSADGVLNSAERSQSNSQNVAQRIADLSSHTRRIAEILEVIRDLANRSELLALNAGLEGTKAGEAGRGFSHVAAQMQRFSESVMGSVKRIRELTVTITEATDATVLATEESTKLASDATRAAEQIGRIIQEQRLATEQATESMMNVGEVAAQSASGSKVIVSSATALATLSDQLQSLVGHFQLGDEGPKSPDDD